MLNLENLIGKGVKELFQLPQEAFLLWNDADFAYLLGVDRQSVYSLFEKGRLVTKFSEPVRTKPIIIKGMPYFQSKNDSRNLFNLSQGTYRLPDTVWTVDSDSGHYFRVKKRQEYIKINPNGTIKTMVCPLADCNARLATEEHLILAESLHLSSREYKTVDLMSGKELVSNNEIVSVEEIKGQLIALSADRNTLLSFSKEIGEVKLPCKIIPGHFEIDGQVSYLSRDGKKIVRPFKETVELEQQVAPYIAKYVPKKDINNELMTISWFSSQADCISSCRFWSHQTHRTDLPLLVLGRDHHTCYDLRHPGKPFSKIEYPLENFEKGLVPFIPAALLTLGGRLFSLEDGDTLYDVESGKLAISNTGKISYPAFLLQKGDVAYFANYDKTFYSLDLKSEKYLEGIALS
ncbi:MAG: hypothetical protein V1837_06035 [Candidatus Woesearchaeota archaeon]